MAAVPSIGRASQVEGAPIAPEASATQALYERYASQIFGYCLHQLGSREEAEDAVQQTFLNAFRGLSRGVVPELEQAWIFKIANNVCLSRRRSSWRRGRIESPEDFQEMQDSLPAPTRGGGVADELVGLQDVLEGMPESQRRAILLREWQGLSYREIADEMELSQSAVETLIFRARRALAQGLEEPPKKTWRKGAARRGLDLGGVVGFVKTLFAGGAAVKVGAAVVAVTAATVAATTPPSAHRAPVVYQQAAAVPVARAVTSAPAVAVRPVAASREVHAAVRASASVAPVAHRAPRVAPDASATAPVVSTPAPTPISAPPAATPAAPTVQVAAPAPPAPAPPAPQEHGNGNASGNGNGNGNHTGQAKHDPAPAPAAPAPAAPAPAQGNGHGNGHANGNGNGKPHAGDPRVPAVVDPAPAAQAPAGPVAQPAPAPPADPGHGNGNANGNGNAGGHGNGHAAKPSK